MDSSLSFMEPYLYVGFPLRLVCDDNEANEQSQELSMMGAYKVSFYEHKNEHKSLVSVKLTTKEVA